MSRIAASRGVESDGPAVIHEDENLRISGIAGGGEALVVAFTGVGHRLGALQREEFVKISRGDGKHSVLFVQDKTRSWYNEPSFLATLQPVVAEWAAGCRRTITIGNSMGGFGAVVFAGALKAEIAIAFSPQYSVSPDIVPQETRWLEFRRKIADFRYESAGPYITDACRYYVFQGDASRDFYQIGGFAIRPNVVQFVFPGGPHNLAAVLRARGSLSALVDACFANDLASVTEIAVARNGGFVRLAADDRYCGDVRPSLDEDGGEEVPVIAEPPPLIPAENAARLERFHQRRQRRKTERVAQRRTDQAAALDRIQSERAERREGVRSERVDARRAAAIARGAELAAERRAHRRAQAGLLGKIRRLASRLVRRTRAALGAASARLRNSGDGAPGRP